MFKVKNIKPIFTGVLLTANRYSADDNREIILDTNKVDGAVKEYQTVLAVGSAVREIKVGDVVVWKPNRYLKKDTTRPENEENSLRSNFVKESFYLQLPVMEQDDKEVMLMDAMDIGYIVEGEEIKDEPIKTPKASIITPMKPKAKKVDIIL